MVDAPLSSAKNGRGQKAAPVFCFSPYAPCSAAKGAGFRVLVALPKGTNGPRPDIQVLNREDSMLWACNKWLLAHPESSEAAQGAPAVLRGENIDIAADV